MNFINQFLSTLSLRRATNGEAKTENITLFLSTLSLRRATRRHRGNDSRPVNFYPRSPCGERLTVPDLGKRDIRISIHALLAESDFGKSKKSKTEKHFYPRSPCGERPANWFDLWGWKNYFYPRSPCGERPSQLKPPIKSHDFYPRSPCGERPSQGGLFQCRDTISIHALLAESDIAQFASLKLFVYFYPRSPCGERP